MSTDGFRYDFDRYNCSQVTPSGYRSSYLMHLTFGCDMTRPEDYNISEAEAAEIRQEFHEEGETEWQDAQRIIDSQPTDQTKDYSLDRPDY